MIAMNLSYQERILEPTRIDFVEYGAKEHMAGPRYWRVVPKRGKAHLLPFLPGTDTSDQALCGRLLPVDQRSRDVGAAGIVDPHCDECKKCLIVAGYIKKERLTDEQLAMLRRLRAFERLAQNLTDIGLSDEERREYLRNLLTHKEVG
jgi:hypothetical protein